MRWGEPQWLRTWARCQRPTGVRRTPMLGSDFVHAVGCPTGKKGHVAQVLAPEKNEEGFMCKGVEGTGTSPNMGEMRGVQPGMG